MQKVKKEKKEKREKKEKKEKKENVTTSRLFGDIRKKGMKINLQDFNAMLSSYEKPTMSYVNTNDYITTQSAIAYLEESDFFFLEEFEKIFVNEDNKKLKDVEKIRIANDIIKVTKKDGQYYWGTADAKRIFGENTIPYEDRYITTYVLLHSLRKNVIFNSNGASVAVTGMNRITFFIINRNPKEIYNSERVVLNGSKVNKVDGKLNLSDFLIALNMTEEEFDDHIKTIPKKKAMKIKNSGLIDPFIARFVIRRRANQLCSIIGD